MPLWSLRYSSHITPSDPLNRKTELRVKAPGAAESERGCGARRPGIHLGRGSSGNEMILSLSLIVSCNVLSSLLRVWIPFRHCRIPHVARSYDRSDLASSTSGNFDRLLDSASSCFTLGFSPVTASLERSRRVTEIRVNRMMTVCPDDDWQQLFTRVDDEPS